MHKNSLGKKKKLFQRGKKKKEEKVFLHVFLTRLDPGFLLKLFQERNDSHSPGCNAEKFVVSSILTLPAPTRLRAAGMRSHRIDRNVEPMLPSSPADPLHHKPAFVYSVVKSFIFQHFWGCEGLMNKICSRDNPGAVGNTIPCKH